jgi:hypothetical protein
MLIGVLGWSYSPSGIMVIKETEALVGRGGTYWGAVYGNFLPTVGISFHTAISKYGRNSL